MVETNHRNLTTQDRELGAEELQTLQVVADEGAAEDEADDGAEQDDGDVRRPYEVRYVHHDWQRAWGYPLEHGASSAQPLAAFASEGEQLGLKLVGLSFCRTKLQQAQRRGSKSRWAAASFPRGGCELS